MVQDQISVDEVHDNDGHDDVAHPVVGVEQQLATRLGEVVDAVTGVQNLGIGGWGEKKKNGVEMKNLWDVSVNIQ